MYEAFTELLTFAEKVGDITDVTFLAEHGEFIAKGAIISGVTSGGEKFTVELSYEREAAANADE